ncbi:MAG: AraC family ligand binding domain-containing protein, partial [Kiloniellales bacterium]|nr:AraC family ligand binding domain-containing protein [Kiloniellales bacterium]
GVYYPPHTHDAHEIYYCISGQLTLRHGLKEDAFDLKATGYSITPVNRLHSLQTHLEPVLLLYIWIGEVACPVWLWEQNARSGWQRRQWERLPDGRLHPGRLEDITREALENAD